MNLQLHPAQADNRDRPRLPVVGAVLLSTVDAFDKIHGAPIARSLIQIDFAEFYNL